MSTPPIPKAFVRGALAGALSMAALVVGLTGSTSAVSAQASQISIEKLTNGVDADAAPGPILDPGEPVHWRYEIRITGQTTLYDLIVSDSSGVVPSCDIDGDGAPDGTHIHPGPLDPGQSFHCEAQSVVQAADTGTSASIGLVKGFDFDGIRSESEDPAHHTALAPFTPAPDVSLQTLVNGLDAGSSPGPYVDERSETTWSYVVTNTGNVSLRTIEVRNGAGVAVDCGDGTSRIAGTLAPGASATCTSTVSPDPESTGVQTGTASVAATPVHPDTGQALAEVDGTDSVHYTPVEVPTALAFTGSSETVAMLGILLAGIGAALWVLGGTAGRRTGPAA